MDFEKGGVVLVRCDRSGVHFGNFITRNGREVTLENARRIWRWRGANTLNEIAANGIDKEWSRVSEPIGSVLILDCIEIMPVSPQGLEKLSVCGWPK